MWNSSVGLLPCDIHHKKRMRGVSWIQAAVPLSCGEVCAPSFALWYVQEAGTVKLLEEVKGHLEQLRSHLTELSRVTAAFQQVGMAKSLVAACVRAVVCAWDQRVGGGGIGM